MKEGQFRQVHWLHDVINVLEPFFLPCHPQYVAFFFFLSPPLFFFFFFLTVKARRLLSLKPVPQIERKKKHQGESSGAYARKANILYKSPDDFSLHVTGQSCVIWPLLPAREAGECSSFELDPLLL